MLNEFQHTLGREITCTGIGLHSGNEVSITLSPAAENTGIVFVRRDVKPEQSRISADYSLVQDTRLGTTLVNKHGVHVATVEHLMAALAGCGVDNAVISLDVAEVPIMDGSSEPFVFLIECAGVVEQDAPRRYLRIRKAVEVRDGDAWLRVEPNNGFSVDLSIAFANRVIGEQSQSFDFTTMAFKNTVSRARTFGFADEVSSLQAQGLALGGSLDNAIVVDAEKVMNANGLRYTDEFVRHKILDCVGDMYLAGMPMLGAISGARSGHGLNNALLRAIYADADAWEWVTLDELDATAASRTIPAVRVAALAAAY